MSSRSNPFEELERVFERMSRQFDEAAHHWESSDPLSAWTSANEPVAVDLIDRDDEYVLTADLPGFERDDVTVRVTDSTLHIDAAREEESETDEEQYVRRERRRESIHRAIHLPDEVDDERVSARMKNGVLEVVLPKLPSAEAREVEIDVD